MIVTVVLWRATVSACGLIGFAGDVADLNYLSQITALTVGVYFAALALLPIATAGRLVEERDPFVRMTVTATAWLVGIVFGTLLGGDYGTRTSLFMHLVVPIVVTVDVLAFGRNLAHAGRLHVVALPLLPLTYLVYALTQSPRPYDFLDTGSAEFWPTIVGALVGIWLAGTVLLLIGRLRRRVPVPVPG